MAISMNKGRVRIDEGCAIKTLSRVIIEEHLGRSLSKGEVVHHIDRDTTNDELSNLQVMTISEHGKLHSKGKKAWNKGIPRSIETNKKRRASLEKTRQRKQKLGISYHCSKETKKKIRASLDRTNRLKKEGIL